MVDVSNVVGTLAANAIRYAENGLEIFPVNPRDKTPLISQYEATVDITIIDAWWHTWPTALIGHRIVEDHVILDIDPRHGGKDTWTALKEAHGDIPATRYHASGRGDGGGHLWFIRPADKLAITALDAWAKEHGVGHPIADANGEEIRWSGGIDILHHKHRYTILPPSPHPDTKQPYEWRYGMNTAPAPMPAWLADLITDDAPPPPPRVAQPRDPDSIADWYTHSHPFSQLLPELGWRLIAGNGDDDRSRWKHPTATSAFSATISHGYLFCYSPNTPLEPTTPGNPHGYSPFAVYAAYHHHNDLKSAARAARELKDGSSYTTPDDYSWAQIEPASGSEIADTPTAGPRYQPIDWQAFWNREHIGEDWLIEPLVPRGRQVALWATHKTGKSLLSLEVAAAAATGRAVLRQPAGEPINVVYVDLEMTEDDLYERLSDMGYGPADDLTHLHYYLLPALPPLDQAEGGIAVVNLAIHHQAQLVVIDTMARAVAGEENDADTYRDFYRYTGLHLKARGISMMRLDHGGKDATRGQRGSSGKGDDVDVVWHLKAADSGLQLRRDVARMSWVPDTVALERNTEPHLHHEVAAALWPAGTRETADELDRLGAPTNITQRAAIALLKEHEYARKSDIIRAAVKYRATDHRRLSDLTIEAPE